MNNQYFSNGNEWDIEIDCVYGRLHTSNCLNNADILSHSHLIYWTSICLCVGSNFVFHRRKTSACNGNK